MTIRVLGGLTGFERHYEECLPEFRVLAASDIIEVNLDIATLATKVLGTYPKLVARADRIRDELPRFDLSTPMN